MIVSAILNKVQDSGENTTFTPSTIGWYDLKLSTIGWYDLKLSTIGWDDLKIKAGSYVW